MRKVTEQICIDYFVRINEIFERELLELKSEWGEEDEDLTFSFVMSRFGRVLAENCGVLTSGHLTEIFSFVERVFVESDQSIQDVMATCFLEAILDQSSKPTFDFSTVVDFLGQHSISYCRAWDEFTGVSTPGLN